LIKELKEMPDYSNDVVKAVENKLGEFKYDQPEGNQKDMVEKGPC
jgi:hypothetical protein